ncbi:aldehyde dehydrogenase [Methyloprofundus sedimenti]|uniref:Aldehyde dehydrogenase n=1 Tax=Methyloprofundus sedimenti TaxID=1420851 RepID=A0A1V8M5Y4_9GAMM|nr:aldehyde dehydrogenase [Methyloprofundus sedimenti]OQK16969.1 aldehyde dehydrogenase [Methyloprofundus sedimenti]
MTTDNLNNKATSEQEIIEIVAKQHDYFKSGATKSYQSRSDNLQKLKAALIKYETEMHVALKQDLGKPEFESYLSETGFTLHDLSTTLSKLKSWMKPKWRMTALLTQPGSSRIYYSPLGVNLIIAPYNYPVMLTFAPLIAAMAAGNTAVIKTSEMTPACSAIIRKIISETFAPEYIAYIQGEVNETTILLQQKFEHIFFTGSPRVGSIVMSAAAKNLTPVTLELGGKSPCIVHDDAKLDIAVNRIVSSKFLNAAQTCVAPDYVLVHKSLKETFLNKIKARIIKVYGKDASTSPDFARIVSDNHFQRICGLIDQKKVIVGGQSNAATRYIAPTVMRDVTLADKVMSDEIFGPVLPVLEYETLDEVYNIVDQLPHHPLACYLFSESKAVQQEIINTIQSGGACINNCIFHAGNHHLPFGGVGESGMGAYHGFDGFECFSHKKGVLKSASWMDNPLTYAPYGNKINLLRKFLK